MDNDKIDPQLYSRVCWDIDKSRLSFNAGQSIAGDSQPPSTLAGYTLGLHQSLSPVTTPSPFGAEPKNKQVEFGIMVRYFYVQIMVEL